MARITKTIKPHIVIVDTNILFNKEKHIVVHPLFDSFWKRYSKDCNLKLFIPQVVVGELTFQHFKEAVGFYKNILSGFTQIGTITKKQYSHTITEPSLKQKITSKFEKWLSSNNVIILPTPTKEIDWDKIIEMAIWREPPFSYEEKEKGFRDSLIMETISIFCKNNKDNKNIAFVSNDELLCQGVASRLKNDNRFKVYSTLIDFENYLKLEKQQLNKEFINIVLRNALKKFFQKENQKSLYYKEKIREKMRPEVEKYIKNPEIAQTPQTASLSSLLGLAVSQSIQTWEQIDSGMYWISGPEIDNITEDKKYLWISKIQYVQQYKRKGTTLLTLDLYEERLLVLNFKVNWEAKIAKDASFWDTKVGGVSLAATSFEKPTQEQVQQWNLKSETIQQ